MEIATLPLVARALKDDAVIPKKCPWGAMTGEVFFYSRCGERAWIVKRNSTYHFFYMKAQR